MTDQIKSQEKPLGPLRLWLVRHGATAWNAEGRFCGTSDIPLSPQGEEQARWLGQQLSSARIAAIHASDLLRARQTAEQIAGQQVPLYFTALWRELAFGRWEGLTYAEIAALPANDLRFFDDSLHFAPPEGESLTELQRALTLLVADAHARIAAHGPLQNLVLVSHGGPLRVLLCLLLHVPLVYQWQFQLAPGSLSALDLSLTLGEELPLASLALLNLQSSKRPERK
jgi:broad specificity phosphatase PhoE